MAEDFDDLDSVLELDMVEDKSCSNVIVPIGHKVAKENILKESTFNKAEIKEEELEKRNVPFSED
ncbi:hypothetical protein FRX31_026323 [Thalictrum thalictroides]|uniref:Uncharacterized protein n=1 Tax=Thalictrum thalictroides TaxID=46969 RepID=A0A7J6VIS6_THATH|nr:hypothetical protein FRX31_026323 [Thalictrum thalictroides]